MLNLWDPHAGIIWTTALVTAFLLGMVHGITPDEHTWPITFSYAIGSYSTKKGLIAGLTFSLAFTLQRAIASELAYLALDKWFTLGSTVDYVVYLIVGVAMVWAGRYILQGKHWHLSLRRSHKMGPNRSAGVNAPKAWMPLMHGFIAGWGFGAFAIIIYTVLAPTMPSAWWGWVPGALFGLGTTVMQALAGALFGWISHRLGLPPEATQQVALVTAGRTLAWGGIAFVVGGLIGIVLPQVAAVSISTGIHVHNLDRLGIAFVLVVVSVMGIGLTTLIQQTRYWTRQVKSTHQSLQN
ncbi:MAG: sulfite exporter TauE/SafE family protein [Firmicutes bacterium]|nr:sulfite exporter TauE/SafE family protein [Bacillota bacterium]